MTPADNDRMWRLYRMAERCRTGGAHVSLRDAALDGIEAEIVKQGDAVAWLREVLDTQDWFTMHAGGWVVVVVRDRHTRGFRGSSGADENEAASSTIARHLPYCGMIPVDS